MKLNLKEARLKCGYTQQEVADLLKTSDTNYNRYELEKVKISIFDLIKLANFYNVSLDYLCGRPFNNGVGYLTDEQRKIVNDIKELDDWQLEKVEAYVEAMKSAKEEVNKELIKRKF